jgi:hypothetical protein
VARRVMIQVNILPGHVFVVGTIILATSGTREITSLLMSPFVIPRDGRSAADCADPFDALTTFDSI